MTNWRFVERVTVRKVGALFIGEARTHVHFATGEILSDPLSAMESAAAALDAQLRPLWEARQAAVYLDGDVDQFEDIL